MYFYYVLYEIYKVTTRSYTLTSSVIFHKYLPMENSEMVSNKPKVQKIMTPSYVASCNLVFMEMFMEKLRT